MAGAVATVFILKQQTIWSDKSNELSKKQKDTIDDIISGSANLGEEENSNIVFYHELLRQAVLSRNNDIILQVLKAIHTRVGSSGDIENTGSAAYVNHAIHLATVRNDLKTLEAILGWAKEQNLEDDILNYSKRDGKKGGCSLQVAILQQFGECVQILNKFGFEIELHEEDKKSIETKMQATIHGKDNSNYFKKKSENVFKRHSQEGLGEQDAIDRYLKFRAFSTPCYIAAAFDNYLSKRKPHLTEEKWAQDHDIKNKISMLDPMRKLFACAKRALELSLYFVQHREEYQEIASDCNSFAERLLEQCEDLSEVRCLLQCDEKQIRLTKVWEIALMEKNTAFVSHHYFQQIMYRKFCGEEMDPREQNDWNNFFIIRKVSHSIFTFFMCLFYPIIIFLDIFRGGSILFESPNTFKARKKMEVGNDEDHQEEKEHFVDNERAQTTKRCDCSSAGCCLYENYILRKFRNNLHRPISRMLVDCYAEFFFLYTLILTIVDPNDHKGTTDFSWYDVYSHFCFFSYLLNNIIEIFKWGTNYFSHFWKVYSLVNSILFVIGASVRLYGFYDMENDSRSLLSGNHYVNVGTTFYALATIMVIFQSARWLLRFRKTGPMVLCIIQVLKDICLIIILFVIIIVGFVFGIWLLYNIYDEERFVSRVGNSTNQYPYKVKNQDYTKLRKIVHTLFWSVFSLPNINDAKVKHVNFNVTDETGEPLESAMQISYEFSHYIMTCLLAVYQGTCVFILLNILIALMNTTYAKISQHADSMWKCSKAFIEYSYFCPSTAVPIPFRYLYYVAKLVYRRMCFSDSRPKKKSGNENVHYFLLSWNLIKEERLSRMENFEEDNFKDLKNDLMNYIDNKIVKRLTNL